MKSMQISIKKMLSLLLILAIIGGITAMTPRVSAAENEDTERTVYGKRQEEEIEVKVYINDMDLEVSGRLIEDTTYMPLRMMSESIEEAEIGWENGIATVNSDTINLNAQQGSHYITANDRVLYYGKPIKNIEGRIYVPIRLLAKAYSLSVNWDDQTKSVKLYGDPKGLKSGGEYYNSEDLYWLSRIIHAESGGEVLKGKIAVGNVVINRKNHKSYPNSIYGVVFDRKHGTQFTPVASGSIYNTPSGESVLAAKICLDGFSLNDEMIFFINPKIATNFWITQTRVYVMTVGNHKFYK